MLTMAGKDRAAKIFAYQTGVRVWLLIIEALLALIMVAAYNDSAAWYWGLPVISLVLVPIVVYFAWVIWQDSGQRVTVTKEEILWEKGAGRFYRQVGMSWQEIGQMRDDTRIFTIGRRFQLVSAADPERIIRIDSSLANYKDLLRTIIRRVPSGVINSRAKKSLGHMRIMQ